LSKARRKIVVASTAITPKLIQGVRFTHGIEVIGNSAAPQAHAAA
jgi:hypothetical protein